MSTLPEECEYIFGGGSREAIRCALCLISFDVDTPTTTHTSCSFVACRECWTDWAARDPETLSCPLCRAPLMQAHVKHARDEVEHLRQQRRLDRHVRINTICEAKAHANAAELVCRLDDLPWNASLKDAILNETTMRMAKTRYRLVSHSIFDEELEEECAVFERLELSLASYGHHFRAEDDLGPADFAELRAELAERRAERDEIIEEQLQTFEKNIRALDYFHRGRG